MQKLFINGNWKDAEKVEDLYSPYDGTLIKQIPVANKAEVNEAIEAAYRAQDVIKQLPAHKRSEILFKVSELLEDKKAEAAKIIALEAAKPIKLARAEVTRTIQTYLFASHEASRIPGETIPLDAAPGGENRIAFTQNEPLGVIGAITPFNFPMNLVAHKVGPAIAAGNSIVLKPANQTPLSGYFICELFREAGLPDGVLNVISGNGSFIGNLMTIDERIKMITFTGSPRVGKIISSKAGLKKITLELGSNSGLIIDTNIDVDKIIERVAFGSFSNQGQVCISVQRIYVHEEIFDVFTEKFVKESENIVLGDPLDENTDLSSLISITDSERVLRWINEAKDKGAKVLVGGEIKNNVLKPTVITGTSNELSVSCEEVFAPLVIIEKISDIEDGIKRVNDSKYGLQAGIYTRDIDTAMKASKDLEVGGVIINDIPTFRVDHMPYGGVKESGVGKEGVKYAVEEMMESKLTIINL